MKIVKITALEILDSRGNPTVEANVFLEDGSIGTGMVPSGASTGKYEAVELRDGDKSRFLGNGVQKAVENIEKIIAPNLIGMDANEQREIDRILIQLDGTENKEKLGANATLAVSMAVARAEAVSQKKPLFKYLSKFNPDFSGKFIMPIPMMNIMNGGKHGNWASDIQEYMILPVGAKSITDAVRMCAEVYQNLKKILKKKNYSIAVGDEGGFAPSFQNNEEPFQLASEAILASGYEFGKDFVMAIDPASSEFFEDNLYVLRKENKKLTNLEMLDFYDNLAQKYKLVSIEDGFAEDDWDGFRMQLEKTEGKLQIIGDDLFVTNIKRLQRGIDEKTCNSILIKLNQIGTVSETIDAVLLARKNNMTSVVSHRSGETEDSFIADFVVAMGTGQIKTGAPARSERTAKYNQLMRIEKMLGENCEYAKWPFWKI